MKRRIIKKLQKNLINRKALDYIIKHSNLCRHAMRELKLAGYNKEDKGPNGWMYQQVIEAIALFSSHDNSSASASWEINLVKKLCSFDILTPLNLKDDKEWNFVYYKDGHIKVYQNNRLSHFFKEVNGDNIRIGNIDAFTKKIVKVKRFGADNFEENKNPTYWHGGFFVINNGKCTGEYIRKVYLYYHELDKPYTPKETIKLNTIDVEVTPDNWISFVDNNSIKYLYLCAHYRIDYKISKTIEGKTIDEIDEVICNIAESEIKDNEEV